MRITCICLATLLLVGKAGGDAAAGKYHEDERWGYKVRVPDGWITAALSADEEWIASKHLAERELVAKKGLWFADSRPEMWVIGFPHERQDQRGTRFGKDEKDEKSARADEEKIFFNNPYRDYKDFLKRERWFAEGGYFFSEEKETEVAGMKVTMYEIKVDKMVESPIRIFTWVYHFDDIDFAVQFKVLEDHVRTHEQGFKACLKSFRRVDRTRALPGAATTGGDQVIEDVDESKLTPEERARHRKEKVEQQYRREIDALPKGWYNFSTEHYLVLANASKKYTNDLVRHAEAVREYLDETFGTLGIDYVPPAILRVFATYPEYEAYSQGTQRFFGSGARQVLVVEGNNPEYINSNLTWQWLDFKNEDLYTSMPDWISTGLSQHMSFCRSQGKKVKFVFDEWDQQNLKTLLDKKEEIPLKDLISGAHERKMDVEGAAIDFEKAMKMGRESTQAGSVVTYLLTTGNKGKTKDALSKYLAGLVLALEGAQAELKAEMDKVEAQATDAAEGRAAEDASSDDDEEESEEEEAKRLEEQEKLMKAVREAMAKKRDTLREKAFAAGFGHLTDKDWKSLDAAWKRFVK